MTYINQNDIIIYIILLEKEYEKKRKYKMDIFNNRVYFLYIFKWRIKYWNFSMGFGRYVPWENI